MKEKAGLTEVLCGPGASVGGKPCPRECSFQQEGSGSFLFFTGGKGPCVMSLHKVDIAANQYPAYKTT